MTHYTHGQALAMDRVIDEIYESAGYLDKWIRERPQDEDADKWKHQLEFLNHLIKLYEREMRVNHKEV